MDLIDDTQRAAFASSHSEWVIDEQSMARTFVFSNFTEAMGFVTSVALISERANHHPDIDIRWNKVTLTLSTHSEGGLTSADTDLAAAIDSLT